MTVLTKVIGLVATCVVSFVVVCWIIFVVEMRTVGVIILVLHLVV